MSTTVKFSLNNPSMLIPISSGKDPARFLRLCIEKREKRFLFGFSIILAIACLLLLQRPPKRSTFVITAHDNQHHHIPTEHRLDSIQLESPILQPLRNTTKPVPTEEDGELVQELEIIKNVYNWRVLGDIHTTRVGKDSANEASIAFFIQIADGNMLMAPRLLSRIWHPENIYCLHFDSKISIPRVDLFIQALKSNPKLSNVIVLPSVPVTYSGISMLLNTLESMEVLLKISEKWDYYINLSGSAYPLVSITAIRRLLGRPEVVDKRTSFIHVGGDEKYWNRVAAHRFNLLHFDLSLGFNHTSDESIFQTKLVHPLKHSGNLNIQIVKGEAWIIAHRTFCEYSAHGSVARRLITLFANMQSTPEHFFQTLAWNHKDLNKTVVKTVFHSIIWGRRNDQSGGHPAYLDRQTESGSYDLWPHAIEYSSSFFARKFKDPNSKLLDHIDSQKSGATDKPVNWTAVSKSFMIVEKRFSCLMDKHIDPGSKPREFACMGAGWKRGNCRAEDENCVTHFVSPRA